MVDTTNHAQGDEAPTGTDSRAVRLGRGFRRVVISAAGGTTANPLDRDSYAQATHRGYSEATGRGLELALVLVVFGGIGWFIDRMVGTRPLFFLLFAVIGFAGVGVKLWLGYDLEMREHDEGAVWSRSRRSTTGKDRP